MTHQQEMKQKCFGEQLSGPMTAVYMVAMYGNVFEEVYVRLQCRAPANKRSTSGDCLGPTPFYPFI